MDEINTIDLRSKNVLLIGEYVTPEGPGLDDHFVLMVDSEGGEFILSLKEPQTTILLEELGKVLKFDLSLRLSNKTDLSSRVIYPKSLKESPMFEYKLRKKSLVSKILSLGAEEYERGFSSRVKDYLRDRVIDPKDVGS